ncbi:MAG: protein-glutamate O-methyltransferase CheR [Myxococcota bacterium]|nr:protein-glutamate O-methyltransferase CheR [Myxococcota bacterium]
MNEKIQIETMEVDLLLETLYRRYGYDFRSYARASIDRRIRQFIAGQHIGVISELIPRVIHDEALFCELAQHFSVSVTEMFRDPFVYRALREQVVPILKSYPFVKVWAAGCATGEEVYSLAIAMWESGDLDRTTIFGTDFNDDALERAKMGIYSVDRIQESTRNYQAAGGTRSFSEYYHAGYDSASMHPSLKERITFANHNLSTDQVFGEMHLVLCRNVLIYFNRDLQNRALRLFTESLVRGGFLCLGTKEDLQFSDVADVYDVVDRSARIYKKRAC